MTCYLGFWVAIRISCMTILRKHLQRFDSLLAIYPELSKRWKCNIENGGETHRGLYGFD